MLYMTLTAAAVAAEWSDRIELAKTSGGVTGTDEGFWSLCWGPFTQTGQSFGSSPSSASLTEVGSLSQRASLSLYST